MDDRFSAALLSSFPVNESKFVYEKVAIETLEIMLARLVPPGAALAVYVATAFVSAGLLFAVEPMISKMALPQLGGAPNVWNTCLFFFQVTLLLGYTYAHLVAHYLGRRWQIGVHLAVLGAVSLTLPLEFTTAAIPSKGLPVLWLLGRLAITIGPTFFTMAATAPLLQYWFAKIDYRAGRDPYFLYAASNLGSLSALIAYPLVIEPNLPLDRQSVLWSACFGVFAFGLVLCMAAFCVLSPKDRAEAVVFRVATSAKRGRQRLRWVAFAFVPSSLLLGVTAHITTDVAATPLFWVVPLVIYLLTFVLAFARRPPLPHSAMVRLLPVILIILVLCGPLVQHLPTFGLMLALNLGCFSAVAMVCHGELATTRPEISRLTEFYFFISLGGVLGGLFNAILAPMLFSGVWEFPLVLVLACLLIPGSRTYHWSTLARDLLLPAMLFVFLVLSHKAPAPHWHPISVTGRAVRSLSVCRIVADEFPQAAAAFCARDRRFSCSPRSDVVGRDTRNIP